MYKLTYILLGYFTLLIYTLMVSFAEGQISHGGGGGGGGTTGWPTALTNAATTSEASDSTKVRIRGTGGQSTSGANFYQSSDGFFYWVCVVSGTENACDYLRKLAANQKWGIQDSSGNQVFYIAPSSSGTAKYPFGVGHYPTKSIYFSAASLTTDGTQCAAPAEVTINSGPKVYTIICTENNSGRMTGSVAMPDSWDGGTITLTPFYTNTAADTGSVALEGAAACRGAGETINGTYGTEVEIDDAAITGSSAIDSTTSAAITPNGTCAAGDFLYFYVDIDATDNPTTAAATLHFLGVKMEYSVTSLSD